MTKKIDNKLYYQVAAWMINDLNLKGQELICYAVIYSLSQLGQGRYLAGLDFLASFMQCSQPTASKALKGLQDRGLIAKEEVTTDTGRRVIYYCTNPDEDEKESYGGVNKKFIDGVNKKFMDNNINNKEHNNINNKTCSNEQAKGEVSFEDFYKLYPNKRSKQAAIKAWNKLSAKDKQKAYDTLPAYISDCALNKRSFQYPATYLNGRTFEDEFGVQRISFYDAMQGDSEEKVRFKAYMRRQYPEIENTALPLSYEDYMQMIREYGVESVTAAIEAMYGVIFKYRKSDIAKVIKNYLTTDD